MIAPDKRLSLLRQRLNQKNFVRIIEAHSGISALVGESARVQLEGAMVEYDGFWESSFTDSASKGLPDIEIVNADSRIDTIKQILEVTSKPIIVDGDTGRSPVEFEYLVRRLEHLGVSAVIIEDKVFPKRNGLDSSARQTSEDPKTFAQKIQRGKKETLTEEFMIIARLESLIAGSSLEDALKRAEIYIQAGVDGIMIHSPKDQPDEILEFAAAYEALCRKLGTRPPLVCVPTTYNLITDMELAEHGFNIIIHANHLLRASYKAMEEAAAAILAHDRGFEAELLCAPTSKIFEVVGFDAIEEQDRIYEKEHREKEHRYSIIIPAAGKDPVFPEIPKSMIKVASQTILDHQIVSLRKAGMTNNRVVVVRGHEAGQFTRDDVEYFDNEKYLEAHSLYSLFCAEQAMEDGFLMIYSDILFDEALIQRLVESNGDIVLLLDNSYRYHLHEVDKRLDLAIGGRQYPSRSHSLIVDSPVTISHIGKDIPKQNADYEFIGIAFFSEKGAETLRKVYEGAKAQGATPFHESPSFDQATIVDIIQEIIDQGFPVMGLELSTGWIEIHNRHDVRKAEEELGAVRLFDG